MELLESLLSHDQWATTELLEVSQSLSDEQLDQHFDLGHGTIRATFAHIIPNVESWTRLLSGEPVQSEPEDTSIAGLTQLHERTYGAFATMARQLRDEQRLDDTFVDQYEVRKSFGGTILMVIQHNAEHRAEIVHMLARLGLPLVPEVDYGVWDYLQHNS